MNLPSRFFTFFIIAILYNNLNGRTLFIRVNDLSTLNSAILFGKQSVDRNNSCLVWPMSKYGHLNKFNVDYDVRFRSIKCCDQDMCKIFKGPIKASRICSREYCFCERGILKQRKCSINQLYNPINSSCDNPARLHICHQ
ncbi:unnamed protein product [Brachionus calyciflorus]|uniref:Chitin-binding type-2 domain-containing protein n=1 Tax=Brachionus calyciflorus TaxID=104777 RepID=A0A813QD61_9BILA|nr:unnamed protein product [Brachionus calyciflorus]